VDLHFRLAVNLTGASSKIRMGALCKDGPSDRDSLLLAAGQRCAVLADDGVVAFGNWRMEFVGEGLAGSFLDLAWVELIRP